MDFRTRLVPIFFFDLLTLCFDPLTLGFELLPVCFERTPQHHDNTSPVLPLRIPNYGLVVFFQIGTEKKERRGYRTWRQQAATARPTIKTPQHHEHAFFPSCALGWCSRVAWRCVQESARFRVEPLRCRRSPRFPPSAYPCKSQLHG